MPIRVLGLNTSEERGGAARAAQRLFNGIIAAGAEVRYEVQSKQSDRSWVSKPAGNFARFSAIVSPHVDRIPNALLYKNQPKAAWSNNWRPTSVLSQFDAGDFDVIHVHWIGGGFVNPSELSRTSVPIVITLHDAWPFTGGCHYPGSCRKYQTSCGQCPQLGSYRSFDLSSWNHGRKVRALEHITVVSPSKWLGGLAAASAVFKNCAVKVIPNGIDLNRFRPLDKTYSRAALGWPQDKKIVLFGAENASSDPRKGHDLLTRALTGLFSRDIQNLHFVVFGASAPSLGRAEVNTTYMGRVGDDFTLAAMYSAADVMVVPSREENLANTVVESLACGTPVVAFDIGGNPDMIEHRSTGYLAKPYDTEDLADGIVWCVSQADQGEVSKSCRRSATDKFCIEKVSMQYLDLFESTLHRSRSA